MSWAPMSLFPFPWYAYGNITTNGPQQFSCLINRNIHDIRLGREEVVWGVAHETIQQIPNFTESLANLWVCEFYLLYTQQFC